MCCTQTANQSGCLRPARGALAMTIVCPHRCDVERKKAHWRRVAAGIMTFRGSSRARHRRRSVAQLAAFDKRTPAWSGTWWTLRGERPTHVVVGLPILVVCRAPRSVAHQGRPYLRGESKARRHVLQGAFPTESVGGTPRQRALCCTTPRAWQMRLFQRRGRGTSRPRIAIALARALVVGDV